MELRRVARKFSKNSGTQVAITRFQLAPHFKLTSPLRFLTVLPMIATTHSRSVAPRLGFEHLLLGDLRELLDDNPGRERDRWLLATLDMLLVFRPRTSRVYLPILPRESDLGPAEIPVSFEKLQRLRDRIAHRAPYEALAQELSVDLRGYFEGTTWPLEPTIRV